MAYQDLLQATQKQASERYLKGEYLSLLPKENNVYFITRDGKTGFVTDKHGKPFEWKNANDAENFALRLELQRELN